MSLQIAHPAPEFTLMNSAGASISLSSLHGKWVVLYFYPKDNTSGCTREAIDFTGSLPAFRKQHAIIIGISPDSPESHTKFIEKHGLRIELLSDPDHTVCSLYGVWRKKKLYGREYFGVVRTTLLIDPEGIIRHVWEKVNVPGHTAEVQEQLASCNRRT
ncbi:MAG: peroxiredoxin [Chitinispirillaceae bacterium]|nr:peroxiredoxin [Chitinispirillaceae bacterium]